MHSTITTNVSSKCAAPARGIFPRGSYSTQGWGPIEHGKREKDGTTGRSYVTIEFSCLNVNETVYLAANKLNSILTWLHAWSCNGVYERTLRFRQPDTCIWLPKTNAFKTWRNTENSFLWLHGKGKVLNMFRRSPC